VRFGQGIARIVSVPGLHQAIAEAVGCFGGIRNLRENVPEYVRRGLIIALFTVEIGERPQELAIAGPEAAGLTQVAGRHLVCTEPETCLRKIVEVHRVLGAEHGGFGKTPECLAVVAAFQVHGTQSLERADIVRLLFD